jgi:hypothetical protein
MRLRHQSLPFALQSWSPTSVIARIKVHCRSVLYLQPMQFVHQHLQVLEDLLLALLRQVNGSSDQNDLGGVEEELKKQKRSTIASLVDNVCHPGQRVWKSGAMLRIFQLHYHHGALVWPIRGGSFGVTLQIW